MDQFIRLRQNNLQFAAGMIDLRFQLRPDKMARLPGEARRAKTSWREFRFNTPLANVEYPIHFLDFETVNPAIPLYADTSPYEVIPFQWSGHILHKDGYLMHKEYLCVDHRDPKKDFTRTFLNALEVI